MYQANRTRQTEDAAVVATDAFSAYMRGYVDERRKSPSDDLITTLIAAEEDGSKLSNHELIATSILLLNAGHEATVHAIGNGVNLLLAAKTTAKELTAPDRIDATIEEILRFDPPLHMFTRIAYEDLDLCGHPIKRGTEIGLLLAAANRDPAKFATPNTFRPSRTDQAHTSFGAGVHFCIGAPLARLEMKTALPILFARHPNLKLSQPVEFADRYHFHGLEDLMVKL
jgi:unspecific monooxygenase